MLLEEMPYFRLSDAMPAAVAGLLSSMPILKPVIPDPGLRFQLVHEDDVASAFVAGTRGKGEPGPYNLAGNGTLTMSDLAGELGWYSVPVPDLAVDTAAEVISRIPRAPESISWIHAARRPVLMKVERARRQLGWKPRHSSRATLKQLVAARREAAPAVR
jgi:nucleoside-diphosphate-sugar epimerase